MDDIEGLAQVLLFHHEGDIPFLRALRQSDDTDAVAPKRREQLAGDAGVLPHVFPDDGDRGHIVARLHRRHRAFGDFVREFFRQQLHRLGCIAGGDAERDARFRRGLADKEDADARVGERSEDAAVHAHDTCHRRCGNREDGAVADRRDAGDRPSAGGVVPRNDGAFRLRTEGVADINVDVFVADGVERGRINDLCAEVAQFHRFLVTEGVDYIRCADDARVGGHEAVHVRPDFQPVGFQGRSDDAGGVVRSAAPEVGDRSAGAVRGDESRDDGHLSLPEILEGFADLPFGDFGVQYRAAAAHRGLDEVQRVVVHGVSEHRGDNQRGHPLAEADDFAGGLFRQDAQGENAFAEGFQLGKQGVDFARKGLVASCHAAGDCKMPVPNGGKDVPEGFFSCCGEFGRSDQLVRDAAQGGHDHHHALIVLTYNIFQILQGLHAPH